MPFVSVPVAVPHRSATFKGWFGLIFVIVLFCSCIYFHSGLHALYKFSTHNDFPAHIWSSLLPAHMRLIGFSEFSFGVLPGAYAAPVASFVVFLIRFLLAPRPLCFAHTLVFLTERIAKHLHHQPPVPSSHADLYVAF